MAYKIKHKGLELNWLRKLDKSLSLPEIVILEHEDPYNYRAGYVRPSNDHYLYENIVVNSLNGIIKICEHYINCQNTIAHEFRHAWQAYNTNLLKTQPSSTLWNSLPGSWENKIIEYYKQRECELDAFLFAYNKFHKSSEYEMQLLCNNNVINYKEI